VTTLHRPGGKKYLDASRTRHHRCQRRQPRSTFATNFNRRSTSAKSRRLAALEDGRWVESRVTTKPASTSRRIGPMTSTASTTEWSRWSALPDIKKPSLDDFLENFQHLECCERRYDPSTRSSTRGRRSCAAVSQGVLRTRSSPLTKAHLHRVIAAPQGRKAAAVTSTISGHEACYRETFPGNQLPTGAAWLADHDADRSVHRGCGTWNSSTGAVLECSADGLPTVVVDDVTAKL